MHVRRSAPPRRNPSRVIVPIVILILVTAASWWYLSHRTPTNVAGSRLVVYYTKLDGTTEATWPITMRPAEPGESASEHQHDTVLYAAVQAVAGPPADVQAVRFPSGTHVNAVTVNGSTATVDLSKEVEHPGGTFGESGEFKSLVYTLTGIPGIDAVQVTVDGRTLATLPGGHFELDEPLHRSDW